MFFVDVGSSLSLVKLCHLAEKCVFNGRRLPGVTLTSGLVTSHLQS